MRLIHLRLIALTFILGGIGMLVMAASKTVTLTVNDESRQVVVPALTVGGLLRAVEIPLDTEDQVFPPPGDWLQDGQTVRVLLAANVRISGVGEPKVFRSAERRPANLLMQAGIRLFPADQVLFEGKPVEPADPLPHRLAYRLELRRGARVALHDETGMHTFYTAARTVGEALQGAGVPVRSADRLDPPADTVLSGNMNVIIERSRPITVEIGVQTHSFWSAAGTVGEALADGGLSLQGLDSSQPPPGDAVPEDGRIRLTRVTEEVIVEQEPVPFETVLQPSEEVELDTRQVLDPGAYGLAARRVRVRYENGQETGREVEDEWLAQPPKPRLMGYGTKVVVRTLDTPNGPVEYWRKANMYATSYSPCRIFEDRCDSYTATGATLQHGIAAMTGSWFRYFGYSQVYVPGYGVATIADTGGGVPGRPWIDLGYSESDYVSWHQWVTVYFLTPVPDVVPVVLP